MRKIAASYIFPISSKPIKQGIVVISDDGEIQDIIDTGGVLHETSSLEYFNGILVPGLINAHCHIELSYMKNIINVAKGLPDFLYQILTKRTNLPENLGEIISAADTEMKMEGIVAVGDISNDDFSFGTKEKSSIYYQTFIEVFWPSPDKASDIFEKGEKLYKILNDKNLAASIVPHAPYTMSPVLFKMVQNHANNYRGIYSIHNQETPSENELFFSHSGALYDLFMNFGMDMSSITPTGKPSLESVKHYFPKKQNILLVHNIFTTQSDINTLDEKERFFLVLCPNSNLIIEHHLPDIEMFVKNNLNLAIGTDSYSSNTKLSIIGELKTISEYYPNFSLDILLKWATLGGAKALGIDSKYGSFEKGKKPGVNLITGIDFESMRLTKESCIKVLI
jgi:aminodeoxyfutalosine deaminase